MLTTQSTSSVGMLTAENDVLRRRVRELEALLGLNALAPHIFGLTETETQVFGILMNAPTGAVTSTTFIKLLGARHSKRSIHSFINRIRAKIKPFDLTVEGGFGYRLSAETKDKVRSYMREEGLVG